MPHTRVTRRHSRRQKGAASPCRQGNRRSGAAGRSAFHDALPKTRSGKIMRRLLRELAAEGQVKGDVTTLEDLNVLAALQRDEE